MRIVTEASANRTPKPRISRGPAYLESALAERQRRASVSQSFVSGPEQLAARQPARPLGEGRPETPGLAHLSVFAWCIKFLFLLSTPGRAQTGIHKIKIITVRPFFFRFYFLSYRM